MSTPIDLLSTAALVHVDVILRWAIAEGRSLDQVANDVRGQLQGRVDAKVGDQIARPQQSTATCPSCKDGSMFVCRQTSALVGAPVLSCSKHCGYSRIVGEV